MATEQSPVGRPAGLALSHERMVEFNEALTIGAVRQHELREAAERLNGQLRAEMARRERAEDALRASEERFRALFDSAPMAVFACDRDGLIQYYNARAVELWGREPQRGVDRHGGSGRMWRPDGTLLPPAESPMAEVLRTGRTALDVEVSIERPDGSRVPVLFSFAALKDGSGKTTGAIASFSDLTERKKLEQQTLRAQRLEGIATLASGIAHDLNNAFGPITTSLDLLRKKMTDPECTELLGIVAASAERGAETVRQVLAFARGADGPRRKEPAPAPENPSGHGELILVVDDELPLRQITQRTLEAYGYRVILASDGAEALAIYKERGAEIATLLTDMTMPGMDGLELIRILRGQKPSLPVIATSGLPLDYAPKLAKLGVFDVLSKPYRSSALLKMMQRVLPAAAPATAPPL